MNTLRPNNLGSCGLGTQTFFSIGSGGTHGIVFAQVIGEGGFRMLYLVCLFMAVHSCESIRICSDESHGIPRIMGNGSPLFTFISCTLDFHAPCPDYNSNFTYSLQMSSICESDDKLLSLLGSGYRWSLRQSQSSALITVQGQPMSISAWTGIGNSVMRGPVACRVV